jgi:uncharacterized protein YciI
MPEASPDELLQRLGDRMARLKGVSLWLVHMTPTDAWPPPPAPGDPLDMVMVERFVEHLDWLERLERDGVLVLSGTVDQELGIGPGLAIIRAESRRAAEEIAESEPFHRQGLRANTVRSWTVNEGSITLTVKLFTNEVTFG